MRSLTLPPSFLNVQGTAPRVDIASSLPPLQELTVTLVYIRVLHAYTSFD